MGCSPVRKLLLLSTALSLISSALAADKPRLGVILPLTGKAAEGGTSVKNSVLLANEALGEPFALLFEDNALDNTRTVSAARALIGQADSLIIYAAGPSNVAAPIAEQARLPMIALTIDPAVSRGRRWVMNHWASNQRMAARMTKELSARSLKRVALLSSQVQGLMEFRESLVKAAKESAIEIVYDEQLLPSETTFRSTLLKMRAAAPSAVVINLYYGQAGLFAREAAGINYKLPMAGTFVLDNDAEIAQSEGGLEGAFFVSTAAGDLHFEREYVARFGTRPALGGINAYDVVTLLHGAWQGSQSNREHVMHYLRSPQIFRGAIGSYSALPDGTGFDVPAGIGLITGGRVLHLVAVP